MKRSRPDLAARNRQNATHGMTRSKTWRAWASMRERCNRTSHPYFHRYGGRGISYSPDWDVFENFLADMGPAPEGLTLERLDNDGNYTKDNCRWATMRDQANNRSSNVVLEHGSKAMTVAQWADTVGLERKTLEYRIRKGWDVSRALSTPSLFSRKAV